MFNKESGHHGEEYKLRVIYVDPRRPPSPVREGSKEDSSPRALVSENGHSNAPEFQAAPRAFNERVDPQDTSSEVKTQLISKLMEKKMLLFSIIVDFSKNWST